MAESAEKGKIAIVAMLAAGGIVASCGSSGDDSSGNGPTGPGGPGVTQDSGGGGGMNPGGGWNGGGGDGGGGYDSGFTACAADTQRAKPVPLSMAVMLDSSGSMWLRTQAGEFKWDAAKRALGAFVGDAKSVGMSIGLQYFPLFLQDTPNRCTDSAQCGAQGPCVLKACNDAKGDYCTSDADCPQGVTCSVPLGQCHEEGEFKCKTDADCKTATYDYGACDPMVASYCYRSEDSCNVPDYTKPAIDFAELPGAAAAVQQSLSGRFPNGYTPTSAALQGLENMAKAQHEAHPEHKIVSVFVTDGLPTRCDQNMTNISAIAAAALEGGIKTYVIGVFAQSEEAQAKPNLDLIAKAGGSDTAFIINTDQSNASQALLQALSTIRGNSLPCEFVLPTPEAGVADYSKVNVKSTSGAGTEQIVPNVPNEAACATAPGWFYDADPNAGQTPSKVKLCPATCDSIKTDTGAVIDILQGCKDIVVK
ncbi:VWA domain-containing protein [Pendulispora brunnea]|uniref:VWA domain-containing protein n=1 Tax=Pendulispora brunnea TaxID=2905690 RepID=A0ABZ2KJM6_9BACT